MKNKEQNKKTYLLCGVTQLAIVIAFTVVTYFMFNIESVVLNPIPYSILVGIIMLILDFFILRIIFNKEVVQVEEYNN